MRFLLLVLVVLLAAPSAAAHEPVLIVAHKKQHKKVRRPPAPPRVKYEAPPADVTMDGYAQADVANGVVYTQGPLDPFSRAHETGHVFDWEVLSEGDRHFFAKLLHAKMAAGQDYWGRTEDGTQPNYTPGSEVFADYYGALGSGYQPKPNQYLDSYVHIGPKRLKRFEKALARLAKRRGITSQYYAGK